MIDTLQMGLALAIGGIGLFLVVHLRNVRAAAAGASPMTRSQEGGVR